jgi:hypothetical protein
MAVFYWLTTSFLKTKVEVAAELVRTKTLPADPVKERLLFSSTSSRYVVKQF